MVERSDWSMPEWKVVNDNKEVSVEATNPITSKKETFTNRETKQDERFITSNPPPKDDLEPVSESGGDQDSLPNEQEDQQQ
jgi:hypothetical protein